VLYLTMTTTTPTDAALVTRASTGDDEALAQLYDRHGRAAYGLALSIVRDAALAEDAVQEGFLAVWLGAATYSPARGPVATWILMLVHRRAVDLVRHHERRRAEQLPEELALGLEEAVDVVVGRRDEACRLRAAFARLTPAQREVVELAFYGGLTQAEIADRVGLPLGTVKSRMFSALIRLRELLGEATVEPAGLREASRERVAVLALGT
jgi:RNA polymerase sigma-70 factor (ECF subfamily)